MISPKVKYLSIYEELKKEINEGKYPVGQPFLTEPELQEKYGVSRITVRHALQLLVDEGFIKRIHGVGTIVLSTKVLLLLQTLLSFSEENKLQSNHSELISLNTSLEANEVLCSKLDLPKGAEVGKHERLRYVDDQCIGFQRVYCPSYIDLKEKDLADKHASLYQIMRSQGFIVTTAQETIESVVSDEELSNLLKIEMNTPLLYVERLTKDHKNRLVEYAEIYYRGDRYRYHVQLKVP